MKIIKESYSELKAMNKNAKVHTVKIIELSKDISQVAKNFDFANFYEISDGTWDTKAVTKYFNEIRNLVSDIEKEIDSITSGE